MKKKETDYTKKREGAYHLLFTIKSKSGEIRNPTLFIEQANSKKDAYYKASISLNPNWTIVKVTIIFLGLAAIAVVLLK